MKIEHINSINEATRSNVVYIIFSYWDDYGYCTTFNSYYKSYDESELIELGLVKIGTKNIEDKVSRETNYKGYSSYSIKTYISSSINNNNNDLFSLGQDINYYKNVNSVFGEESKEYYILMNDLAYNFIEFKKLYGETLPILVNSLMRTLHYSNVVQFHRVSKGESELTNYEFKLIYDQSTIDINVKPHSLPPSNIHVLIGRNGVGKTWLLHNIVYNVLKSSKVDLDFKLSEKYSVNSRFSIECESDIFAGVIGLSFSVFDDALFLSAINDNNAPDDLARSLAFDLFSKNYKYIGLIDKNQENGKRKTKSVDDLTKEFTESLKKIKSSKSKIKLFLETCANLKTDAMFNDNGFIELIHDFLDVKSNDSSEKINGDLNKKFKQLSSGHMIILLSLTLLTASIYEKTLVLIDEPETHLHPPLLSTYIRTLSFLLVRMNAVAIIATHSPIVLQEVPRDCVSRIERIQSDMFFNDIKVETFATSTDSLTREVFGLELTKTGFYQLIEKEIENTFEESFSKFNEKIGFLGQVLMKSLVKKKVKSNEEN